MARFQSTLKSISASMNQPEILSNGAKKIKVAMNELEPSELNTYNTEEEIEELAFLIKEEGLLQQFVVMEKPQGEKGYIILAGHRRHKAILLNIANGDTSEDEKYDAICYPYTDDEARQKMLISITNFYRKLSSAELYTRADAVIEYYDAQKEKGERVKGGYRNFLAKQLKTNPSAIQSIQTIRKKAIPEVVEKVVSGEFSIDKANNIAKKSSEEQKQIIEEIKKNGNSTKKREKKKPEASEPIKDVPVENTNTEIADSDNTTVTETNERLSRSEIRMIMQTLLDELPISDEEGRNIVQGIRIRIEGTFAMEEDKIRNKFLNDEDDFSEDVIDDLSEFEDNT